MRIPVFALIVNGFIFAFIFNISLHLVENKAIALGICSMCSYIMGVINEKIRCKTWE